MKLIQPSLAGMTYGPIFFARGWIAGSIPGSSPGTAMALDEY